MNQKSKIATISSMLQDSNKSLYQPWRHKDFKSDVFVQAMEPVARWMYLTLLHEAFDYSTRPYLPDDDNVLWLLAGCESKKQWSRYKDAIRDMFTPLTLDGKKLLSQKRAKQIGILFRVYRDQIHINRTEAGRRGGLAKARKALESSSKS